MNKKQIIISGLIILSFLFKADLGYCLSLDEMFGGKSKEYKEMLESKENESQQLIEEKKKLQSELNELKEQNAALSRDYKKIEIDRDNLLAQVRSLSKEKEDLSAAREAFEKVNEQNSTLLDDKEMFEQEAKLLRENLGKLKLHLTQLTQEKLKLESQLRLAQTDQGTTIDKYTGNLRKKIKQLQVEMKSSKKEKVDLTRGIRQAQKESDILERENLKLQDKTQSLTAQLDDLEKRYDELKKENRNLEKEARTFPRKFAEMARQNKRLIEQAADMHYNSGVFFVKNKEYKQAIKEFERVLDVKPEHAYANYNLGYIYAEYQVDREKAIQYFKNYLTYASDAKDADWVRKYIYTWQTWYGKETAK